MGYGPPNRFLQIGERGGEPLRRVYARVDSVDQAGPEARDQIILLDAVDARAFDETDLARLKGDGIAEIGVSVVEIRAAHQQKGWRERLPQVGQENQWLEVTFDAGPGAWRTRYYSNLFGGAIERPADIRVVGDQLKAQLNAAFSLDDAPEATLEQVAHLLERARPADFLNVLDVGQGNACGLWRNGGGAEIYFDLGGGVQANVGTFPSPVRPMCFRQRPPVVLSHWDWDHWSSGLRYGKALECPWLVPRQMLGAVHRAFAYELLQRGNLLVWPNWLVASEAGRVTVVRCFGTTRNDSGLAIFVNVAADGDARRHVLLPGDAGYSKIPRLSSHPLQALVASHHGAVVQHILQCTPAGPNGVLVYSYGDGNTFNHPRSDARQFYQRAGWPAGRSFETGLTPAQRPYDIGLPIAGSGPASGCGQCGPRVVT